jgi:hypothetical protein
MNSGSVASLILVTIIASVAVCAADRGLKTGDDMISGKGMMMGGGMMGDKGKKGGGGGESEKVVPSFLQTYFIGSEAATLNVADINNPWTVPGDMTLISGPFYVFPEEEARAVATIYGVCTTATPSVADYCHLTVYYDDGVVKGGWTYMGVLFNPLPSTEPADGQFTIVGTSGDFAIYTGGVAIGFQSPMGNVAQNVTFYY